MRRRSSSKAWGGHVALAGLLVLVVAAVASAAQGSAGVSTHLEVLVGPAHLQDAGSPATVLGPAAAVPSTYAHPALAVPSLGSAIAPAFSASITASPSSVDVEPASPTLGSYTTNLTAHVIGGVPGYGYLWNGLTPAGCYSSDLAVIMCIPTVVGSFPITVTVEDSTGAEVTSPAFALVVHPDPSVSIRATPNAGPLPYIPVFNATFDGGVAPFTYSWNFGDGSPESNASSPSHQYYVTGGYNVVLVAHDATGAYMTASTHVSVIFALQITLSVQPINYTYEWANLDFNVTIDNGTGIWPYAYAWDGLPSGCPARDLSTISCSPNETGTYHVSVSVTDGAGEEVGSSLTVILRAITPTPAPPSPLIYTEGVIFLAIGIGVVMGLTAMPGKAKASDEGGPTFAGGSSPPAMPPSAPEMMMAAAAAGPPPEMTPSMGPEGLPGPEAPAPETPASEYSEGPEASPGPETPDLPTPDAAPPPDDATPPPAPAAEDPSGTTPPSEPPANP